MASVLDSILTAVKARADALGLTIDGHTLVAQRRTELVLLDGIDVKWTILMKGSGPESSRPFATGDQDSPKGYSEVTYTVEVAILTPSNFDPTKNEADLLLARQKLRRAYQAQKWAEVPGMVSLRVASPQGPGPGQQGFRQGLRPDALRLTFTVIEPTEDT